MPAVPRLFRPFYTLAGPVQVLAEAAKPGRVSDRLCAELGLMDGSWKLLETGGVYPD